MNDYDPLRDYLRQQSLPEFVLTFEQIEEIIDAAGQFRVAVALEPQDFRDPLLTLG